MKHEIMMELNKVEKEILISDPSKGYFSEKEINNFSNKDCNDYLSGHTKDELNNMILTDKKILIIELEYNFQKPII